MANKYLELIKRQQKEINELPMRFAFSQSQFDEILDEWGLTRCEEDMKKIMSIGYGGYMLKTEYIKLKSTRIKHREEFQKAIDDDLTGSGFIYDMFLYELENHEYSYTYDEEDALNALGITYEMIYNNERLMNGLKLAKKTCLKSQEQEEDEPEL